LYTKAIEEKNDEPVFYSNSNLLYLQWIIGAMVLITIEQFDKAIEDCD
jgi:hypothetical protein